MAELANAAFSTLASGIDADDTSLSVASGHGARFPASNFYICVYDNFYPNYAVAYRAGAGEIMLCSSRTTDALTVTRAQAGTSGVAFNTTGRTYKVELNIIKEVVTAPFVLSCYVDGLAKDTYFISPSYQAGATSTEANTRFYLPDGNFSVIGFAITGRSGGAGDFIAVGTVRKNAGDTSMTATAISSDSATPDRGSDSDVDHQFSVTTGDYISIKIVTTTSTQASGNVVMAALLVRKDP